MYGMYKTTVYLPEELKLSLERAASQHGISEAELIREAVRAFISRSQAPRPRLPLFESGLIDLAERSEDSLSGFGEL
jgi:Ribbon-helix-helix protein, copG family.